MTLLEPIEAPYRAYNGAILNQAAVDACNAETARVNSFLRAGQPVPDHILNGKHRLFWALAASAVLSADTGHEVTE